MEPDRKDTYLFSIVVKNLETGFGIPVAFFLTKMATTKPIMEWLTKLKEKMESLYNNEFVPVAVVTDKGPVEPKAILQVWPLHVHIFYCSWHILQAWERRLTPTNLGSLALPDDSKNERKLQVCSACYHK